MTTVLLTRSATDNQKMNSLLKKHKALGISLPMYEYKEKPTTLKIKKQLHDIDTFDWIIFSSERAVYFFLKKYQNVHKTWQPLKKTKIAVVGDVTASALRKKGIPVAVMPQKKHITGLLAVREFQKKTGLKILIPQAADARKDFITALGSQHHIETAIYYKKKKLKPSKSRLAKIRNTKIDCVLFFSASAVKNFYKVLPAKLRQAILQTSFFGVIGPSTAKALKTFGFKPQVVAREPRAEILIRQCLAYYAHTI